MGRCLTARRAPLPKAIQMREPPTVRKVWFDPDGTGKVPIQLVTGH